MISYSAGKLCHTADMSSSQLCHRCRREHRRLFLAIGFLVAGVSAHGSILLYDQMTNYNSTIIPSSWYPPDGLDGDTYAWDNFRLAKASDVTEVWWVGGGGTISGVTVRFYEGLASAPDYQPKITSLPESEKPSDYLKGYRFTLAETHPVDLGGGLYSYHVTLQTPLHLPGNTTYWVKIEGDCTNGHSWGIAKATRGRDTMYFRFITGFIFQRVPGGLAFQLRGKPSVIPISGIRK